MEPAWLCMHCNRRARLKCGECNIYNKEGWPLVLEYPVAWWGNAWDVKSLCWYPCDSQGRFEKWPPVTKPMFPSCCWVTVEDDGVFSWVSFCSATSLSHLRKELRAGSPGCSWVAPSAKSWNLGCDRTRGISLQLWQLLAGCQSVSSLSH